MTIKFLKAGNGDSILIQHDGYNIIIDGGNDSKYLLEEVRNIYSKRESIDLLVITHHDDDHIKGIIDLLNLITIEWPENTNFIKKVIFNSPRLARGRLRPVTEGLLSYKQAHDVEGLLIRLDTDWTIYTDDSPPIIFSELTLRFLAPNKEDIKEYSENKGAFLTSDYRCDWNTPMHILERYIDDSSLDNSLFNRNSVVVSIDFPNKRTLLTGDITPSRFEQIVAKLVAENDGLPVEFDYIKLPHHGSYRSLNKSIIQNIKCTNFIITTNSKRHFLPNKKTILKILQNSNRERTNRLDFMFNYREAMTNLCITEKEKKDYNFNLIPNNEHYGFVI